MERVCESLNVRVTIHSSAKSETRWVCCFRGNITEQGMNYIKHLAEWFCFTIFFSQPQMLLDNLSSFSLTSNNTSNCGVCKHSQHIKCYRPNYYIFKCTQDVQWFWIKHPGCSCQGNDEVYTKCRHAARCYQHVQYLCICTTYKRWPQIDCAIFDSYHKIAQLYLKLPLLLSIAFISRLQMGTIPYSVLVWMICVPCFQVQNSVTTSKWLLVSL